MRPDEPEWRLSRFYAFGFAVVLVSVVAGFARPLFLIAALLGAIILFYGISREMSVSPTGHEQSSISQEEATNIADSRPLQVLGTAVAGLFVLAVAGLFVLAVASNLGPPSWVQSGTQYAMSVRPSPISPGKSLVPIEPTIHANYRLKIWLDDKKDAWRGRGEVWFTRDDTKLITDELPRDVKRKPNQRENGIEYAVFALRSRPWSHAAETPSLLDWKKATAIDINSVARGLADKFPPSDKSRMTVEAPVGFVDATKPAAERRVPTKDSDVEATTVAIDEDVETAEVDLVGFAIRKTPDWLKDQVGGILVALLIPTGIAGALWRRLIGRSNPIPAGGPRRRGGLFEPEQEVFASAVRHGRRTARRTRKRRPPVATGFRGTRRDSVSQPRGSDGPAEDEES